MKCLTKIIKGISSNTTINQEDDDNVIALLRKRQHKMQLTLFNWVCDELKRMVHPTQTFTFEKTDGQSFGVAV